MQRKFFWCRFSLDKHTYSNPKLPLVRAERATKPTAPRVLYLERVHQRSTALLLPGFSKQDHQWQWGFQLQNHTAFMAGVGSREPQSLQVQRVSRERHGKGSTALHRHCCLCMFLIWAIHGSGPQASIKVGVRIQRPAMPTPSGTQGWKRQAKGSTALQPHPCLHSFLRWATCVPRLNYA